MQTINTMSNKTIAPFNACILPGTNCQRNFVNRYTVKELYNYSRPLHKSPVDVSAAGPFLKDKTVSHNTNRNQCFSRQGRLLSAGNEKNLLCIFADNIELTGKTFFIILTPISFSKDNGDKEAAPDAYYTYAVESELV